MTRNASRVLGLAILLHTAAALAVPRTYDVGPNLEDNFFDNSSDFGDAAFYSSLGVVPSADGVHVYVASGPVIETLEADPLSGKLRVVQEIHDGDAGGAPIVETQDIAISPDDAHVYVADRFAPALVFRALVPSGLERWKAIEVGPTNSAVLIGYKMKDKQRAPEGISSLVLKAKTVGNAKMKLKGKGDLLTLPVVPPPLPLRVQLQADGGTCWEAIFSNAGVVTSAAGKFIAKSD